jgi:O-antigen/teichoic acid export membrane protein
LPVLRFFDSTVALLVSQILSLLAAFAINLAISRTLGDTGKGLVTMLVYVPSVLFSISHLGMGAALQYFVSRNEGSPRAHLSNALLFPLMTSVVVIGVFCIGYESWKPLVNNLPLGMMVAALIALPLMIIYEVCSQQLVAHGRILQKSIADVIQTYAGLVVIVIVLLLPGRSAERVFAGYVIGWGMGASLNLYYSTRIVGWPTTPSWKLFAKSFRYGIWIYINSAFIYLLTRADFFILVALQSSIGLGGVYSVAAGLTMPLIIVPYAVQTVFFPRASAQTDDDANRSTPFYFRQLVIVMTSLGVIAALLSHPVLLLFGGSFVAGQVPMLILLVATILRGTGGILSVHVLGRGRSGVMTSVTAMTLGVALLLNFLLIPPLGMIGAALATAGAYAAQNVLLIFMFRVVAGGEIGQLFAFSRNDLVTLWREGKAFLSRLKERYRPSST